MPSILGASRAASPARVRLRIAAVLALALGAALALAGGSAAQDDAPVHVLAIDGEIDLGLAPFLERALREAEEAGAAAVLLEIDTPGGRLDAVLQMRDSLLDTPLRTIAYVDRTAFSAGALVALASEEIHFAPGGAMGAATPVLGGGAETADPKVVAAVRSTFRATAEERGRDPRVAEAMVDADVEIEGLVDAGSLLSLSASDARAVGYSDGMAEDRDDLLTQLELEDRPVVGVAPSPAERVVRFITNPILASVLVTIGVLLVVGELVLGAFGLASAVGLALLGTFFYGHLLAGLAGWEDVALVAVGIVLILVELFVVPGFGVPGVLGLASILGGSYLAMVGRDLDFVSSSQLMSTATTVGVAFIGITIGIIALLVLLSRRRTSGDVGSRRPGAPPTPGGTGRRGWLRWFGDGDVLARENEEVDTGVPGGSSGTEAPAPPPEGPSSTADTRSRRSPSATAARKGAVGVAVSDLRPAGVASFDGQRVDVVTEGDYIAAGERIEVLRAERYRRVVRRVPE